MTIDHLTTIINVHNKIELICSNTFGSHLSLAQHSEPHVGHQKNHCPALAPADNKEGCGRLLHSLCRGQEQRLPLARAGALGLHGLSSTFRPTVPPSTAAPGDLALGSALAAGAPAPATGVPRAQAPASALHNHPWEATALSEGVTAPQGIPAHTWGSSSPAVLMSQWPL